MFYLMKHIQEKCSKIYVYIDGGGNLLLLFEGEQIHLRETEARGEGRLYVRLFQLLLSFCLHFNKSEKYFGML